MVRRDSQPRKFSSQPVDELDREGAVSSGFHQKGGEVMKTTSKNAKGIFIDLITNHPPHEWEVRLEQACGDDDTPYSVESAGCYAPTSKRRVSSMNLRLTWESPSI